MWHSNANRLAAAVRKESSSPKHRFLSTSIWLHYNFKRFLPRQTNWLFILETSPKSCELFINIPWQFMLQDYLNPLPSKILSFLFLSILSYCVSILNPNQVSVSERQIWKQTKYSLKNPSFPFFLPSAAKFLLKLCSVLPQ